MVLEKNYVSEINKMAPNLMELINFSPKEVDVFTKVRIPNLQDS